MEFKTIFLISLCLIQFTISAPPNKIFIAGDSTADGNGANNGKTNGWGKVLGDYLTVPVVNHAVSGQSVRTYYKDGGRSNLIKEVSKCDFVFIQFGYNEVRGQNQNPKGTASGTGEETVTWQRRSCTYLPIVFLNILLIKF